MAKQSELYDRLHEELRKQTTIQALLTKAASPEFISEAGKLDKVDLEQLRADFASFRIALAGQVKLEELSGEEVEIVGAFYRKTIHGNAYSLSGKRANGDKFQAITSAVALIRFFDNNSDRCPIKVVMTKEDHPTDKEKHIWRIREKREGTQGTIPF